MGTAAWTCIAFGLCAVVACALVSEIVRWDRRRPGVYPQLPELERRRFRQSLLWPGFNGMFLAGLSARAGASENWTLAGALFAAEAVVLLWGARWTLRWLRQTLT